MPQKIRQRTHLESTGAEYLVIANLLLQRIQAFKSPENKPGYDVIATDPEWGTSVRIQVKSRWATDFDGGFPIKNFNNEFVVFVALNRGFRYRKQTSRPDAGKRDPVIYVLPKNVCKKYQRPDSTWGKLFLRDIPNVEVYRSNWELIRKALRVNKAKTEGGSGRKIP